MTDLLREYPHMRQYYDRYMVETEGMSQKDRTQRKIDRYNAEVGTLNLEDGYNCKVCKNRGHIAEISERNGVYYDTYPMCKCMDVRKSIYRLKRSGLEGVIREKTFKTFVVTQDWQCEMVDKAKRYISDGVQRGSWLYFGGAIGSGKTHLCTAVARELLHKMPLYYIIWAEKINELKAFVTDDGEYDRIIRPLKTIDVLYIDDLFKPAKARDGSIDPPTPADIKHTFEVINYRYINKLPTIISSEKYTDELLDIDDALGSRIIERSKGFCVSVERSRDKNYRLK